METYRNQLRHIVRPEDPTDRQNSDRVPLDDYEALYLRHALPMWAAYNAETQTEEEIAVGYGQYINQVIRDEGKNFIYLYAHTPEAKGVLQAVVGDIDEVLDIAESVESKVDENL